MRRHARVRHIAQHPAVIAQLEFLRVAVQAELRNLLADALIPFDQVLERVVRHRKCSAPARRLCPQACAFSLARNALKEGQMSSLRSISTVWKLGASRRRNTLSIEDS